MRFSPATCIRPRQVPHTQSAWWSGVRSAIHFRQISAKISGECDQGRWRRSAAERIAGCLAKERPIFTRCLAWAEEIRCRSRLISWGPAVRWCTTGSI